MVEEDLSTIRYASAIIFFLWYGIIQIVAYLGFFEILNKFKSPSSNPQINHDKFEGVTIVRPIKGIDPELSSCLESSFLQNYPRNKLQILFCVDSPCDESVPIIINLIEKYEDMDAQILFSEGYDNRTDRSSEYYGPNPKVNNLAKGFLKAKYDIIWVMDSNVWASPNILANSIMALNNDTNNSRQNLNSRKVKLVHHVPLAVSVNTLTHASSDSEYKLTPRNSRTTKCMKLLKKLGARLDEMFLMTSHLKFYVSLNNLAFAPCVNGKSNIYRISDLDNAVAKIPHKKSPFFFTQSVISDAEHYCAMGPGNALKLFARYIGEDNMIGICIWENLCGKTGLTGDCVIQPLSGSDNSINDYVSRRVRWLRVRKYMVLIATLIEPSTESIVCGIFGTYAISTLFWNEIFKFKIFIIHLLIWMMADYKQYYTLVGYISQAGQVETWMHSLPPLTRSFWSWFYIWLIRELLALPIWIVAMSGHEIDWRGRPFKIKKDLTAEAL